MSTETINGVEVDVTECEKLSAHAEDFKIIAGFLDWLNYTDMCLAEYDNDEEERLIRINATIEELLAMYFDINLNKVEKERQAILDALRKDPNANN